MDYKKQAIDFLKKTGTSFKAEYICYDSHFIGETKRRDIYKITLENKRHKYAFRFGQSLIGTEKGIVPVAYDVLSCLQKYDVETFKDFCSEYGYDAEEPDTRRIYSAVQKEFQNVCKLFLDEELEELQEIN